MSNIGNIKLTTNISSHYNVIILDKSIHNSLFYINKHLIIKNNMSQAQYEKKKLYVICISMHLSESSKTRRSVIFGALLLYVCILFTFIVMYS